MLTIHTVFFGNINHCMKIFRLYFINDTSGGYDKTAIFSNHVNELFAVVFYVLDSSCLEQRGGDIPLNTQVPIENFFCFEYVGCIKPGENTVVIEPLAPKSARIVFYATAE